MAMLVDSFNKRCSPDAPRFLFRTGDRSLLKEMVRVDLADPFGDVFLREGNVVEVRRLHLVE